MKFVSWNGFGHNLPKGLWSMLTLIVWRMMVTLQEKAGYLKTSGSTAWLSWLQRSPAYIPSVNHPGGVGGMSNLLTKIDADIAPTQLSMWHVQRIVHACFMYMYHNWKVNNMHTKVSVKTLKNELLYKLLFSRGFYFREFREPDPRENFHFNSCLFIVMTTSEKSRN